MTAARTHALAAELREAFDRSFAAAPAIDTIVWEDFLAVRVGGRPYAFRLSEVGALHRDRKVVPVASPSPELMGIAAFRGTFAPVYDLAPLLGHAATQDPRWLVLAGVAAPVALAFEALDGHARVERTKVSMPDRDGGARYVRGAVELAESVRPLIDIGSVVEAIARRAQVNGAPKER